MERCVINGQAYLLETHVRDLENRRHAFNQLAMETFGLDFEPWYRGGWWGDRYRPCTLFDGERAAANVSVNFMEFSLEDRKRRYLQLGTVMTAPAYRGRGLARWLMEYLLRRWGGDCDGIYLFANDAVLDFYPRFGFVPVKEQQAVLRCGRGSELGTVRRLSMDCPEDRALLLRRYASSNPFSSFSMEANPGLLMFYATGPLCQCLYEVPQAEAVVVLERRPEGLCCYDVFGGSGSLSSILSAAAGGSGQITLGFTPKEGENIVFSTRHEPDETLFVLEKGENPIVGQRMFPLLSHA